MTPEQKERLEYLRTKGPTLPVNEVRPVHFTHVSRRGRSEHRPDFL
jgi:hypothetical protein